MSAVRTGLTADPIDARAVADAVRSPAHGAVLVFEGVGRDSFDGRPVLGLEYEAWPGPAEDALRAICAEAEARWPVRAVIVHRTGYVGIGDASVVIAIGGGHRAETYEASRHCIEALKVRVPIWKKERYADGAAWIANSVPEDPTP